MERLGLGFILVTGPDGYVVGLGSRAHHVVLSSDEILVHYRNGHAEMRLLIPIRELLGARVRWHTANDVYDAEGTKY
jgi:hypothetical protein